MSGETIKSVVLKEDTPREGVLSGVDRMEVRRGEGLILISGESEKRVTNVGEFAVQAFLEAGIAEEVAEDPNAKIARLEDRIAELEQKLARGDRIRQGKNDDSNDEPDIEALIQKKVDERTAQLSGDLDEIKGRLARYEEGVDGFVIGDFVGRQTEDDEDHYDMGYIVIGYPGEKIRIKDLETGDTCDMERSQILHENELDADDDSEFEPQEEVASRQANGKYKAGYKVIGHVQEGDEELIEIENQSTGQRHSVQPSLLKRTADLSPDEIAPANTDRKRYVPRETFLSRLRNATPWAAESRKWYIDDDGGPYYLDDDGREVYVSRDEVDGRTVGAVAIGGAFVVGAVVAWELIGERIFGIGEGSSHSLKEVIHNQTIEIGGLSKLNHHLTEVNTHLTGVNNHITDVNNHLTGVDKHLTQVDNHIHRELVHDHRHELRKITNYGNALENLERHEQSSGGGFREHLRGTGAYWGFRYPWDWAANKVGTYRAESLLHTLASKAAAHGHKVRWIINGFEPNGSKRKSSKWTVQPTLKG